MSPVQGESPLVQVKEPYRNFDMVTCRLSSCNPECTPADNSEHSSQRAKRLANNVSSYGRDMIQNGLGFMHSVSLKSHGPVLLSMKLLPYPVNQSCFPSV